MHSISAQSKETGAGSVGPIEARRADNFAALLTELAGLRAEREAWRAERAGLIQQRDELTSERDTLQAEAEALRIVCADVAMLLGHNEALQGKRRGGGVGREVAMLLGHNEALQSWLGNYRLQRDLVEAHAHMQARYDKGRIWGGMDVHASVALDNIIALRACVENEIELAEMAWGEVLG